MHSRAVSPGKDFAIWNVFAIPFLQIWSAFKSGDIFAQEGDCSCGRGTDTGNHIEERGLSRTVRTYKPDDLVLS